ncbi:MAG TPA: Maf family protein [Chthonomonas sp.]|uniref:Maf family protein n=1 Tax=Chthonomonas sp. TaxID=2282153 RepID=UPI002B4AD13E|nr:Maf family protein [Chthonomonas sp.]HLH79864.1 Maf family protein [Chthonomonas sp.]
MTLPHSPMVRPKIILASASPRRRELMALLRVPFEIVPSRYQEPSPPATPVSLPRFVTELAISKATDVAQRIQEGLVLGADTEVSLEGEMGLPLGKPATADEARAMLRSLAGRTHSVYTALAIISVNNGILQPPLSEVVCTRVRFRELTEAMIEAYIETKEPFDKAGAYGAQGYAAPYIEAIEGDFFNVVGLPLCALGRLLEKLGIAWWQVKP